MSMEDCIGVVFNIWLAIGLVSYFIHRAETEIIRAIKEKSDPPSEVKP